MPTTSIVDDRSTGRRPFAKLPRQFDGDAFVRPPAVAFPYFAPWEETG